MEQEPGSSEMGTEPAGARVIMDPAQLEAACNLFKTLHDLRAELVKEGDLVMQGWGPRIQRGEFRASAGNLADWLALRRMDLRPLQAPLSQLGLSTLGRLDAHVRPSVDAVIAALAAISGQGVAVFPPPSAISGGQAVLEARRDALFGVQSDGPATRIMVTLPSEAAGDGALIERLVEAGADCFRINCAHDGPEAWGAMVAHIGVAGRNAGRHLPISMDLGGPKFRVTAISTEEKRKFFPGDRFTIARNIGAAPKGAFAITLSHGALLDALTMGAEISIDDGKLWANVVEVKTDAAILEVTRAPIKGGRIRPEKGVNLPGSDLRVDALTPDDLSALDFVVKNADIVAFSFVQTVADVKALVAAMEARVTGGAMPAIMLKIETPLGLRNLPELIVEAGGVLPVAVMIARGDLAVEIGFERLSEIQEEILWLCDAAQVPVVWATQVLEGMVSAGQATRAEVTDAAMGQRAECVMLNKGPYIVEAVGFLRGVLTRMDRHQSKKSARLGPLHLWADLI